MIKTLKLMDCPNFSDYRNGYEYDEIRFKDENGDYYVYIGIACTNTGIPAKSRSKLLDWAWDKDLGTEITLSMSVCPLYEGAETSIPKYYRIMRPKIIRCNEC